MKSKDKKQAIIFAGLIIGAILLVAGVIAAVTVLNMSQASLIIILIVLIFLGLRMRSNSFILILKEYERAVVFRYGKFVGVKGPGIVFIIPFIDTFKLVDLRTKTVDIPAQEVVTKSNIKLKIDAILYIRVVDPKKAVLEVEDYQKAAVSNIQASLRSVIGKMELQEVISNIDKINELLRKETELVAKEWGIVIENVEIQSVQLPTGVQEAIHKRKQAEQEKLAQKERAEGRKIMLEAIEQAASQFTDPTLKYLYLQALEKMAEGKSAKIIFPVELMKLAEGVTKRLGAKEKKEIEKANESLLEELKEKLGAKEKKKTAKKKAKK